MEKVFIYGILIFLWIFSTIWVFNHIDSWVGIAVFVLGVFISAKLIFKQKEK